MSARRAICTLAAAFVVAGCAAADSASGGASAASAPSGAAPKGHFTPPRRLDPDPPGTAVSETTSETTLASPAGGADERASGAEAPAPARDILVVKCALTVEGECRDCRIVKGSSRASGAVIDALQKQRFTPAMIDGRPVRVPFVFRVNVTPPASSSP